ncbi:hypothetical protein EJ07DRAFT_173911 [Lizonia empirigonia]|nr:hypothetical protein EJ07DRAFT_173911 [Lizonia empirigonia]
MARRSAQLVVQVPTQSQSCTSDAEADESQRIRALSSLLQTPRPNNKELRNFNDRVAADQGELAALLKQRKRQAEEASLRRRNELSKSILDALQTPNRPVQGSSPTLGDTKIARNAIFKSFANILTASQHLIGEYDGLDKKITGMRDAEPEGRVEAWAEDVDKTARLLKIGAETAIRNVKKVLGAEVEAEEAVESNEGLAAVGNMELNYELQKSLQYAERGVKKMVKGLPQDEGH